MIVCDGIAHVADLVNDNLTESKVGHTKDSPTLSTDLFDLALLGIQSRRTTCHGTSTSLATAPQCAPRLSHTHRVVVRF